jgi:signal transduction histidine kinase
MGDRPPRVLPSVRVRITLAATAVTAATVIATGVLLVRAVEGTQLGDLADRTETRLDEVVDALAAGQSPGQAVESTDTDVVIQVLDERGCPVANAPVVSLNGRWTAVRIGAGTAGGAPVTEAGGGAGGRTLTIEREDGTTIECPVPDAMTAPLGGEVADPGPAGPGTTPATPGDATTLGGKAPGAGPEAPAAADPAPADRVQMVNQGAVSQFPFETVSREVETPQGRYTVQAASPVDEVRRSVEAVRRALWWVLPALIATVAAVAWVLVGRALRPVEAIRAEVETIGGTTMHRRVPEPPSHDEVGRLARTMNAMLGRLESSARRQRQFVSDASHELRSPVATIRADVEVAQLEGERADWPAVAASVLREEARLERLIDDLLVLAAADEGAALRSTPVDVAALAVEDAARARRVAVAVAAGPAGDPGVVVDGDPAHLRRVVANLVDNAARHARARVELTVAPQPGGTVRLTVDDDGDGIAPADRERVFERFARLDEGRARDRGGAGLGLAVVRSLVARHRGTVTVDDAPAGGARFTVELPASRRAAGARPATAPRLPRPRPHHPATR